MKNDYLLIKNIVVILRILSKHNLRNSSSYAKLAIYYNVSLDIIHDCLPKLRLSQPNKYIVNVNVFH